MHYKNLFLVLAIISVLLFASCKDNWLDVKPDKSLIVPENIQDYQNLLDNTSQVFNLNQASNLGEISAGDFYITDVSWASLFTKQEKSAYYWAPTAGFYNDERSVDWENAYKRILNTNVILDGIGKIVPIVSEKQEWNQVKGSALFFRAYDFFNLAQTYCKAYNKNTAGSTYGVPLRLDYNVNVQVKRSNLQQTYDQVTMDLKLALRLLSSKPAYKTRPSKEAAFALLARTYLIMGEYENAGLYADSALQIQSVLIDYATLNASTAYPLERFNAEVIFHNTFTYGIFNASRLIVVPDLFGMYGGNDYRRDVFFRSVANGVTFRGNYSGDKNLFGGLATDELYLIRAEASARAGNTEAALADLNKLLRNRTKGTYQVPTASDPLVVLRLILTERRKELVFRGLRWSDLRRFNQDPNFAVTLTRTLNGQTYQLLPQDGRYVLPIDEEEIRLSGITQNER